MTILGVMISNKEGALIFYRNYSELGHVDFEDFAYQLGHSEEKIRQHTYTQLLGSRLVFLPLEGSFLSLITNLQSNIIQDQKTLSLCKEIVQLCLKFEMSEEVIQNNFLDLAFGLDDIINMGTGNNVTCSQVEDSLRMESSNEQAHLQMLEDRVRERRREIEEESREIERNNRIKEIVEKEKMQIEKELNSMSGEGIGMNTDMEGNVTSFNNDAFLKEKERKRSLQLSNEEMPENEDEGEENVYSDQIRDIKETPSKLGLGMGLANGVLGKKEARNVKKKRGAVKRKGLKLGGKRKKGRKGKVH